MQCLLKYMYVLLNAQKSNKTQQIFGPVFDIATMTADKQCLRKYRQCYQWYLAKKRRVEFGKIISIPGFYERKKNSSWIYKLQKHNKLAVSQVYNFFFYYREIFAVHKLCKMHSMMTKYHSEIFVTWIHDAESLLLLLLLFLFVWFFFSIFFVASEWKSKMCVCEV